jgi:hypothetical protein
MEKKRVEEIPKGSKFKAPPYIKRTEKEVGEADTWWKGLSGDAKYLVYLSYQEGL